MDGKGWILLIISAILLSGIFASSDEEDFKESSSVNIRKKRLIDGSPHGNQPVKIETIPYIVNIQRDGTNQCGATILWTTLIITAAHCFLKENATYTVVSGAANLHKGTHHNVTRKIINPDFHAPQFPNDLALIFVDPPIDFVDSPNRNIELHDGKVKPNAIGNFSGWGCTVLTDTKVIFPNELRSIAVPILSHAECRIAYPNNDISAKEVCTLDKSGKESSCNGDSGGPLAVNDKLLGVMSWGGISGNGEPDVFVNVAFPKFRRWINSYLNAEKKNVKTRPSLRPKKVEFKPKRKPEPKSKDEQKPEPIMLES